MQRRPQRRGAKQGLAATPVFGGGSVRIHRNDMQSTTASPQKDSISPVTRLRP